MRPIFFTIFLLLMLAGNSFAVYKMFTAEEEFLRKFPRITPALFSFFRLLPVINIIAVAGLWFYQGWAACLAIACGLAVIAFDVFFRISYHLYVAVPSFALLLFFLISYRAHFK